MKNYLLVVAIVIISTTSFAQETESTPVTFNIGAEIATPVGSLDNISNFGFGISALAEYKPVKQFGVTFSAGYIHFFGKNYGGYSAPSLGQIPVLGGVRLYVAKEFYVSGQLGYSFFDKNLGSGFTYAPGIGAKFNTLDVTLKYMAASVDGGTLSNIGLRLGYSL